MRDGAPWSPVFLRAALLYFHVGSEFWFKQKVWFWAVRCSTHSGREPSCLYRLGRPWNVPAWAFWARGGLLLTSYVNGVTRVAGRYIALVLASWARPVGPLGLTPKADTQSDRY